MIINTATGAKFNTELPAKSNLLMVLGNNGRMEHDTLKLTGKYTLVSLFRETITMIEVEHSFGTTELLEETLWQ